MIYYTKDNNGNIESIAKNVQSKEEGNFLLSIGFILADEETEKIINEMPSGEIELGKGNE